MAIIWDASITTPAPSENSAMQFSEKPAPSASAEREKQCKMTRTRAKATRLLTWPETLIEHVVARL